MEEKKHIFKMTKEDGYFRILVRNGEIISIESYSKEFNEKVLDEKLKMAVRSDFEEFLKLFQTLRMDTSEFKKSRRILREEKKELEESIRKINRILME